MYAGEGRCIIPCSQDPEDVAREIEKYAKEPTVVGIYLPTAGVNPLWGHRKYDPIFQAAQDGDLPVLLHSVTVVHTVFACHLHEFQSDLGQHTLSHTFAMMANMVSMIETGVPVRFPNLRVAFTEAGVSWVPFMMHRNSDDWVVRFSKSNRFPARQWAERMAMLYNLRVPRAKGDIMIPEGAGVSA